MHDLVALPCDPAAPESTATALLKLLQSRSWVRLVGPQEGADVLGLQQPSALWPEGPGLVLSTGGSSGGRSLCLHPLANFERSAEVCGRWLQRLGLDPEACLVWNPLPFQHVSGLMPWWRARQWGSRHGWLASELMKQPSVLLAQCRQHPGWRQRPMLLSLVPTQLRRLLAHPDGCNWLQAMDVIWVGGAALPLDLAALSRQAGLRLAPCYGATETAAMVTVQTPQAFLAGHRSCGQPLEGVRLRLDPDGALAVHCDRLAAARLDPSGGLQPLVDKEGWWRSGDLATLGDAQVVPDLQIVGRRDGALQSGGVTVFPEQLEDRLLGLVDQVELPLSAVLILGLPDPEWGARLVALVRWSTSDRDPARMDALRALVSDWPAAERPRRWVSCPDLEPSRAGKWDRQRWQTWLVSQQSDQQQGQDDDVV
ncbi:O-succinylbenzoic acid--CoA ligase (OSB-CoA synthetase) [Synechococcus sp. A18-25c]|uniref:AMP-binding protein n=1 Tax=unclassified Synechococcus TaxID=2626047 RepID=UPI0016461FF8|nr:MULTISPECIES: AMP-binding protein [unclassified Synechococcus]QNI49425.1 O-succinylbenzoic acid--CoA ligase (OSB-CoA synthetase) [Synechococcus sp. A15-60]QNJ21043.1 O-succinylbenzoic acid--CoA ligase (OSB-CoA synthetase) [Synechococcus sp. A18-25c]